MCVSTHIHQKTLPFVGDSDHLSIHTSLCPDNSKTAGILKEYLLLQNIAY